MGYRVAWHYIDAYQLDYLRDLFKGDWSMISRFARHTEDECRNFWKRCRFAVEDSVTKRSIHDQTNFTGDAISTHWGNHKILVTEDEASILNDLQKVLDACFYPYSAKTRTYTMVFVVVWILGCDFLILIYGIKFDIFDIYEFSMHVLSAIEDAMTLCPSDWLSVMDYLPKMEYLAQNEAISAAEASIGMSLLSLFGDDASGAVRWLLTVVSSLLLSWFIWAPLVAFATSLRSLYTWEPYTERSPQEFYDDAVEKNATVINLDVNDLIFQPHSVLLAQRRLLERSRRSIGRLPTVNTMRKSYDSQHNLYATLCGCIASVAACFGGIATCSICEKT